MLPSFSAEIHGGQVRVAELANRESFFDGKHVTLQVFELDKERRVVGGKVFAGVVKERQIIDADGNKVPLDEFEGREAILTIRHDLMGRVSPAAFDERFQLGAKLGDVDD